MSSIRIIGRRQTMPLLLALILAAVIASPAALAQDEPLPAPPAGFTGGAPALWHQ